MTKEGEHEIIESALTAIEGIMALPILDRHKRDLINAMLWKLTEARGKHATRYCSKAARAAANDKKLQHDHVTTRKHLIDEIMANPDRARKIGSAAVGCTVTKEEHDTLTKITREQPHLKGWERYEAAGIAVIDNDQEND